MTIHSRQLEAYCVRREPEPRGQTQNRVTESCAWRRFVGRPNSGLIARQSLPWRHSAQGRKRLPAGIPHGATIVATPMRAEVPSPMSVFRYLNRRNRQASSRGRAPKPTRLTFETLEARTLVTADLFSQRPLGQRSDQRQQQHDPRPQRLPTQSASSNADPAPFVNISLLLTDSNDNPITGPLLVGETFWIDVLVDDTRSSLTDAGVDSAETKRHLRLDRDEPDGHDYGGPDYPIPTGSRGSTSSPGSIQNLNGSVPVSTSGPSTPPGTGPKVFDRIQMTATGPQRLRERQSHQCSEARP